MDLIILFIEVPIRKPTGNVNFVESVQKEENYIHCQIVKVNAGQSTFETRKDLDYNKRLKNLLTCLHPTLIRQLEYVALNL